MLKQCLFWENAKSLLALFEAKTNGCHYTIWFWHCSTLLFRFAEKYGQYNASDTLLLQWCFISTNEFTSCGREVRPSASIWTNRLFLALSKFCLRTNHCSAWVQSSPWKEHPDFSRRIHPYHKIPGPRWKLIVCGKLRTQ